MSVTISIEHDGVPYKAHVATIRSTRLGWQDHGIFTADVQLEWDGGGVSVGGYSLDTPEKDAAGKHLGRVGTAFGLDQVMQIVKIVGVENWESLKGKQVYVLFAPDGGWGSTAAGLANLSSGKALILKEHSEAWREKLGLSS